MCGRAATASWLRTAAGTVAAALVLYGPATEPAAAARVANKVAVFQGLDKITGRTTTFDVYINETVQFGALQVTPKVCYSLDDAEEPKTDAFVEVDEVTLTRTIRRIFTGWMFAASPGLNALQHPIYDVWLKGCKMTSSVPPPASQDRPAATQLPPTAKGSRL